MTPVSVSDKNTYYCTNCRLRFGAIPNSQGEIVCPVCKQKPEGGIVQIGHVTYRCTKCNLRFGAVKDSKKPIECPRCNPATSKTEEYHAGP